MTYKRNVLYDLILARNGKIVDTCCVHGKDEASRLAAARELLLATNSAFKRRPNSYYVRSAAKDVLPTDLLNLPLPRLNK